MKFFLHKTRVLKTRDLCGIFTFAKRVFRTRDATFHYSFKRCLTYYIEKLHNASLLIAPRSLISSLSILSFSSFSVLILIQSLPLSRPSLCGSVLVHWWLRRCGQMVATVWIGALSISLAPSLSQPPTMT